MENAATALSYEVEEQAPETRAQPGKYLEEDIFDRTLPTALMTLYFCAAFAAIAMGLF